MTEHPPSPPSASGATTAAAAAERAAIARSSGLSDDILRDIGLDRGGIRDAVRNGFPAAEGDCRAVAMR